MSDFDDGFSSKMTNSVYTVTGGNNENYGNGNNGKNKPYGLDSTGGRIIENIVKDHLPRGAILGTLFNRNPLPL